MLEVGELLESGVVAEHVQHNEMALLWKLFVELNHLGMVTGVQVWDEQHLKRLAVVLIFPKFVIWDYFDLVKAF